jgi:hypothetical protein
MDHYHSPAEPPQGDPFGDGLNRELIHINATRQGARYPQC